MTTDAITEPGIYEMTNAEYHAQPALSASGMKTLLEAPAKFKYEREHPVHKDIYDFGSAWHMKVLGDEGEVLVVVQKTDKDGTQTDAYDYKTKSAQEHRDEIRDEGKVPILAKDLNKVDAMVAAFRANEDAAELIDLSRGKVEQSAFWQDEQTGVWLRARFDYLPEAVVGEPFIIGDPKTAASSKPEKWLKSAGDYGYDLQQSLYREAVRALGIHPRPRFKFAVQEKEPPFIPSVIELDARASVIGDYLVRAAINTFVECTAKDEWPGYVVGTHLGQLPNYYANQFEGLI